MKEKFNFRRALSIMVIVLLTGALTIFFCSYEKFYIDEWLCFIFLDIIYLMILVFEMTFGRLRDHVSTHQNTTYIRIVVGYFVCVCIIAGSVFAPTYARPIMLVPIIMYAVSNVIIAIICSMFLGILLSMTAGGDYYELMGIILLIVFGAVIAQTMKNKVLCRLAYVLVFVINLIIAPVFNYWCYKEFSLQVIIGSAFCGLVSVIALFICDRHIRQDTVEEEKYSYLDIIDDNFQEIVALKDFSVKEYNHAKKVSHIAYKCAEKTKLDKNLCAAAGMYYRYGKILGDDYVNLAVERATKLCFPVKLIQILAEYYGEQKKPSTPESALVHIVDAVIKKTELLAAQMEGSQWNSEMIIYQTLNELSSTGIYDESGLGMNQFFIIRECIAREARG